MGMIGICVWVVGMVNGNGNDWHLRLGGWNDDLSIRKFDDWSIDFWNEGGYDYRVELDRA